MDGQGYACIMLRAEESAAFDQLLALAQEVFDLPPEHAAALAQGALTGEETMIACLPPRPARALLRAAEEWAAARAAPLSFRLSPASDAFSGLTFDERAKRSYRAPRDPFAAWRRSFVPSLLGLALLPPGAWLQWRAGAAGASLLLLGMGLSAGLIVGWLWLQRRYDNRRALPLSAFWWMILAPLALFFLIADSMAGGPLGLALGAAGLILLSMGAFLLLITGDG